jgi:hypothetical protein
MEDVYNYLYAFRGPGSHNTLNFIHPPCQLAADCTQKAVKYSLFWYTDHVYTYMDEIQWEYMQKCAHKYLKNAKIGGQAGAGGWDRISRDCRTFRSHDKGLIMMGKDDSSKKVSINSPKKAKMG